MERINSDRKELLELRYGVGASLREIAQQTGRAAGAIQVALSRLRRFLLHCIEQERRAATSGN